MGFFSDLWQAVRRAFVEHKCPMCNVSNVDLPENNKIKTRMLHQGFKWMMILGKPARVWEVTEELTCPGCGHIWSATRTGEGIDGPLPVADPEKFAAGQSACLQIVIPERAALLDPRTHYRLFLDHKLVGDFQTVKEYQFDREVALGPHVLAIQLMGVMYGSTGQQTTFQVPEPGKWQLKINSDLSGIEQVVRLAD